MPLLMATLNFQPFITMQAKKRHFHLQLPPAEHRLRISIQDQTHHPFAPRSHGPLHLEHPPAWDKHESPLRLFLTPIFPRKGRKKNREDLASKPGTTPRAWKSLLLPGIGRRVLAWSRSNATAASPAEGASAGSRPRPAPSHQHRAAFQKKKYFFFPRQYKVLILKFCLFFFFPVPQIKQHFLWLRRARGGKGNGRETPALGSGTWLGFYFWRAGFCFH